MKYSVLLIVFLCTILTEVSAQKQVTEHILELDSLAVSPNAKINDVAWISGTWQSEALGGIAEEIWSEPMGNSMMATFKLVSGGKVQFYEIEIIRELNESLILQLKHFNHDLKGWEAKDQTVDFPLVKITDSSIYFSGMTFEKVNDSEMNVYVLMHEKEGSKNEIKFNYKR